MKLLDKIIKLIYPDRCPYCNKVIKEREVACKRCLKTFPKSIITRYCKGSYICYSPFIYRKKFAKAIKQLKFKRRRQHAEKLAYPLAKVVKEKYKDIAFDLITCVPMHKNRLKKRGYNHAEVLAKELSSVLCIPYKDLIKKIKDNKEQHKCTREERYTNVKDVYKAIDYKLIKEKTILVVDDIITSGNTLGECCKTLRKSGGKKICCVAVCATAIVKNQRKK